MGSKVMKKVRLKKGYSVRGLAEEIGVNYSSISLWENGKRRPRSANAFKLEKALGKPLNELMRDEVILDEEK